MPSLLRPVALTIPMVTVWPTPNGFPIASTMSPTRMVSECPSVMTGKSARFIFKTATSVSGSEPMTLASAVRPSLKETWIASAPLMTWWLVNTRPESLIITPEPKLLCSCFLGFISWSRLRPKNWRKTGSSKNGCGAIVTTLEVLILTTAGAAASTASA